MSNANIIFSFEGTDVNMQCSKGDKIKDICQKYVNKIQKNLNSLVFLYGGNQLNFQLSFKEQANSIDEKRNEMKVLVYRNDNDELQCPKCGEKININNGKINDIKSFIKNINDTVKGIKLMIENIIKASTEDNVNVQLKNVNVIFNNLNEDIKKLNTKIDDLLINKDINKNISNMNQNNMKYMNQINISKMNQINMSNMDQNNLSNINQINISKMNQNNMSNMNQNSMSNMNQNNISKMNQINISKMNKNNMPNMNQLNMSNMNQNNQVFNNNNQMAPPSNYQRKHYKTTEEDRIFSTIENISSIIDKNEVSEINTIVQQIYVSFLSSNNQTEFISDVISKKIKHKLHGEWFVLVSESNKNIPFNFSTISESDILTIKIGKTKFYIAKIK